MPPAFNLSQDQTLQLKDFDLQITYCCASLKVNEVYFSVSTCSMLCCSWQTLAGRPRAAPSAQAPTLIGCDFLKSERPNHAVRYKRLVAGRGFEPLTFGL